jgi:hypothetical protein
MPYNDIERAGLRGVSIWAFFMGIRGDEELGSFAAGCVPMRILLQSIRRVSCGEL